MSWTYFKLLMWKNWLIKLRNKIELAVQILFPLVFFAIILGIRAIILPEDIEVPRIFDPVSIGASSLDKLRIEYAKSVSLWEIDYTPAHPLLDKLVTNAALDLALNVRSFNSSRELEKFMLNNQSFVGVVFDVDNIESLDQDGFPVNFTYSLRFPGALRTDDRLSWMTNSLFPTGLEGQGPRSNKSDTGGQPNYITEGFAAVQNAISLEFIKLVASNSTTVTLPEVELQRFPYPPYVYDPLIPAIESMVGVMIVFAFMFPSAQAVKYIVVEKEQQLTETMKIMGLSTVLHWVAWFTTIIIILVVIEIFLMLFLQVPWFEDFTVGIFTHSSWTLILVVFFVYALTCVSFAFMMSSFFTKASIAAPVTSLFWFVTYIPFSFTSSYQTGVSSVTYGTNVGLSVFSNTACPFACSQIMRWEALGIGAQWSNLFESPPNGNGFSLGLAVVMMLADSILYMLIALYVEKVMPGAYGIAYKWYFLFTKSFWCPSRNKYVEDEVAAVSPGGDDDRFEPEVGAPGVAGVQLVNLKKQFGKKYAVNGLNVKMYENQITVLLGHNGAGKTTAISMITGLISPTSGTAYINGYNIRTDFSEIRKSLGFCPQHNILFNELTVEEHIEFYSILKGIPMHCIRDEVDKYVRIMGLEGKRKALSKTLSGGLKRKLSVCIALCGDSKVVLCDEPSAGMDPSARRGLWELLQNEKKGRTILLTTHLMDEADVLGDRIAIMSEGRLKCSGTPFFLKKRFGTGYKLICSKNPECNTKSVTDLILDFIPNARIKSEVGTELTYELPEKYANVFEPMLHKVETRQMELGLSGYGISMTTLEDVFLKTGTEEEISESKSITPMNGSMTTVLVDESVNLESVPIVGPNQRYGYVWRAMFYKKAVNFMRTWILFLIQVIVPVLFIVLSYFISKSTSSLVESLPQLTISLDSYDETTTLLHNNAGNNSLDNSIEKSYISMFHSFPANDILRVINESVQNEIIAVSQGNLQEFNTHYMVAATLGVTSIIGWFNNQAYHTAPLALNLIHNAIAKAILGSNYTITVINDPLPLSTDYQLNELKTSGSSGLETAMNTTFAMAYVTSIFIMFLITERVSRSKLLQFISGVPASVYWISHFLWDFLVFTVISAVITLVMLALRQDGFQTSQQLGLLFLTLLLYGFASLPMTYWFSYYFDEPASGLARLSIIHVFTGDALFIMAFIFNAQDMGDTLSNVGIIFPNFALAASLSNQITLASTNVICDSVATQMGITVQDVCEFVTSSCCDLDAFGWDIPGNGRPYVAMLGVGLMFLLIVIIRERHASQGMLSCLNRLPSKKQIPQSNYDDDVANEKMRVASLQASDIANKKLVMHDITKHYKKVTAVNRVSVAVERYDCFGLLGVNGAGKTSTFKMMTGDEPISKGNVWVEGNNIATDKASVYELIGYCPQFDALLMDFTGLEILKMFATLRGVPSDVIGPLSHQLAVSLAFEKHLQKQVKDYSGGNRRKLSTAIALLGNPHLVFLDEPTAGVDPASRRKLWDMVCYVRDIGRAIILTSHSMEECEALCTRIAIMVNGEFKCIGSAQHLKNKYSPGITLTIKLGDPVGGFTNITRGDNAKSQLDLDDTGFNVLQFMNQQFYGSTLKASHKRLLTFEIPTHLMSYSKIFGLMESNKKTLNIEDYSLSQGTLEQVFLSFTDNQRDH